ncbi:hypothetical protein [uncultured Bacteroides sp.]|uniref:coiled-coil domain-containing protein n=1 Tax=uncultured Bacteroides sp. TaxID=162156 RepID=UPI002618FC5B|nr:hypothetical protein [uncultured Bacteroides sp.]
MMISIANPIYDAVFKYLMEDSRVARTILSALLKREVVELEMRKHEYTNNNRDKISMFRIDFGAKVRQDDGSLKLILIELQKTWVETETLRFRQYLGTQYADPDNMQKNGSYAEYGIPMVTVYLLGHRVGNIEEPVVYVRHKAYNYDGEEVTKGIPDPFVESLVHDSIIVQIPLLHGYVGNRLEEILSIFDQTKRARDNAQVLNIDEDKYSGDAEMEYILHRLLSAASNAKLRQDMNVEDEYFSAIENRDTAIMMRDKKIAEQDAQIEEKNAQIEAKDAQIEAKDAQIEAKDAQIEAKDAALFASAKALKKAGLSDEQIRVLTGLTL